MSQILKLSIFAKNMRGIVVEEDVHYGIVENVQPQGRQQQRRGNNPYSPTVPQKKEESFIQIGDEPLFQTEGFKKSMDGWAKTESILLTTKHFHNISIKEINKLKIYKKSDMENHHILKVGFHGGQLSFSFSQTDTYCLFYKTFWAKLAASNIHVDPNEEFINSCDGICLKKSEIMGEWEQRFVMITAKNGLMSFRNRNDAPTLEVSSTNELWTRFALLGNRRFIIFKFWYGVIKEEIAVPLERSVKWLKAFYSLLKG